MNKLLKVFFLIMLLTVTALAEKQKISTSDGWSTRQAKVLENRFSLIDTDITNLQSSSNLGTGNIFYVDSGKSNAATVDGKTVTEALPTLDAAIAKCTADNGDIIYVMQGHRETWSAAGAKVLVDVNGVTIKGLGNGDSKPRFTLTHAGAVMNISAPGATVSGLMFYNNVDAVVADINVLAADCILDDIEIRDAATNKEAVLGVLTNASADRLIINNLYYNGNQGGDGVTAAISLIGIESAVIQNSRFFGKFGTAAVDMETTDCNDILVDNCYFYNSGTALTKDIVDTITGSTWMASNCFDGVGGYSFSGGSGTALASSSVSTTYTYLVDANKNLEGDIGTVNTYLVDANKHLEGEIGTINTYLVDANKNLEGDIGGVNTYLVDANKNLEGDIGGVNTYLVDANKNLEGDISGIASSSDKLRQDANGILSSTDKTRQDSNGIVTTLDKLRQDSNGIVSSEDKLRQDANGIYKTASPVYGRLNYFVLDTPFASATWQGTGAHEILTVTGDVRMRIVAECNQTITQAADVKPTLILGTEKDTDALLGSTEIAGSDDANSLAAGDIWIDTSPGDSNSAAPYSTGVMDKIVVGGYDVGYTIGVAGLTGGCIRWHIWWEPLDASGNVAAGAGGGL